MIHTAQLTKCGKSILYEYFQATSSSGMIFAHIYSTTEITFNTLKKAQNNFQSRTSPNECIFQIFWGNKICTFGEFTDCICSFMHLFLDFSATGVSKVYVSKYFLTMTKVIKKPVSLSVPVSVAVFWQETIWKQILRYS